MSQDTYQLDRFKHGKLHIDRYNKNGQLIGRYRLDGTPLFSKGDLAPPIPHSDWHKFERATRKAK